MGKNQNWRNLFREITGKIKKIPWNQAGEKLWNFQQKVKAFWQRPQFDRVRHFLRTSYETGYKLAQRKGIGFWGKLSTIMVCSYFLSDITAILVSKLIPEPPPRATSRTNTFQTDRNRPDLSRYDIIFERNLFNSRGLIPGEDTGTGDDALLAGGPASRTSLPLNLLGTIILEDTRYSIGTLEDKSNSRVYPLRIDDEIPGRIKVTLVERRKVTFINLERRRLEFVDLPEEPDLIKNPLVTPGKPFVGKARGIERVNPNRFIISRAQIDESLSNLNKVLTQARAIPNFENGAAAGYKIINIVPGSIYDQLGIRNGDVIAGINGEPISDPGKAFQMLQELKDSNNVEITLKRDGKEVSFSYDIQ